MLKLKLSELKKLEGNPRTITKEDMQKLTDSIKKFGVIEGRPLLVSNRTGENIIIGGNQRYEVCKKIGIKEAPVSLITKEYLDDVIEKHLKETGEQMTYEDAENELIIRDNISNGEWDWDILANEWDKEELEEWGLDIEYTKEEPTAEEDDFEVDEGIKTDIVLGDLFEIGPHRLLCGDSTNIDDVNKLMNGEKADMAHNDPPYGMKKENEGVMNDNLNFDDLIQFNKDWISIQFGYLKDNGSWYCWGIDEPLMDIYSEILKPYIKKQKATFRNLITWDKGNGQGQNSENTRSYAIADEKCLFVMCGVQDFKFERNEGKYNSVFESIRFYFELEKNKSKLKVDEISKIDSTRCSHYWAKGQWEFPTKESYKKIQSYCQQNNIDAFKKEYDELKKEYDELKKEYYSTRAYFNNIHDNFNNVWKFDRTSNKEREYTGGHATPKPIALCERAIKSSCPDEGLVIDFFGGSGSTMVACHQLNRKCYMSELDPKYVQTIINRMIKLDPTLEIKRNGQPYNPEISD